MSKIKDLAKFSIEELKEFFASFDVVFSDIDGVLWNYTSNVHGALEALEKLRRLDKKVYLVTNNSMRKIEYTVEKARSGGLEINSDNVITISKVIVWYLKKINFHGDVVVVASDEFRNHLKKAGIQIVNHPRILPSERATVNEVLDRPSVKAVIVDFDPDCNWAKMCLALSCMQREETIYLSGASDKWLGDETYKILGPGLFLEFLNNISGKKPIPCGKPSEILKDYLLTMCDVSDPKRCLFIGDTIQQDMKFASMCNFIKLFVDTGCNRLEEAIKEEDARPDYYISSLGELFSAFKETEK